MIHRMMRQIDETEGGKVIEELEKMLLMQALDVQMQEKRAMIEQIPLAIKSLQDSIIEKEQALKDLTENLEDQRKLQRKLEADLQDNESKIGKYNIQLNQIRSNDEYRTMLKQIDTIKYQNSEIENAVLETLEEIDSRKIQLKKMKNDTEEFRKTTDQAIEHKKFELKRQQDALAELLAEWNETRESLSREFCQHYDKLVKLNKFPVVAIIEEEKCSGCHLSIRPAYLLEIKQSDQLNTCENCFRYIYWKDQSESIQSSEN